MSCQDPSSDCLNRVKWVDGDSNFDNYEKYGLTDKSMTQQYLYCCEHNCPCDKKYGKDCGMFDCSGNYKKTCKNPSSDCLNRVKWVNGDSNFGNYEKYGLTDKSMTQQYLYCCEHNCQCDKKYGKDCGMFDCSGNYKPSGGKKYKITHNWSGKNFNLGKDWIYYKNKVCINNGKKGCAWSNVGQTCGELWENIKDNAGDIVCCTDQTQGRICYGQWNNLISFPEGKLKIDVSPPFDTSGLRKSIRLETENIRFNGGLFILDIEHIPSGLSTWPSIWLVGDDWPNKGEIDIIEGVNLNTQNISTLHTSKGCTQNIPGILNPNCNAGYNGTTGCGIKAPENTFGAPFNKNKGGVFVCEWIFNDVIKISFFPRNAIPSDILSGNPEPDKWDPPYVTFEKCPNHFNNLKLIIDTTLCGQWAGNVYPGGLNKCINDLKTKKLSEAYWLIRSIKVYQKS
jgi:hypothetical protein